MNAGNPKTFDLASLLQPISTHEFFSTHWGRQHLRIARNQPTYYESLITAAALEGIISDSDVRYPAVRIAKGGGYFAPEVYTKNVKHGDENFIGVPDVEKISAEYRQGATIALPAIHRTWTPLGRLCEELQSQLDHATHANVYITPGNANGFTPHYDVHEVFVLQIAGKKRWQLYPPVVPLPHKTQLFTPALYTGQTPMAQVELQAGDLLYLPPGFLHSTTTSDSFSAHVTIGVSVYTWVDLLKEYLSSAVDDEELREALPPGFASREDLQPQLRKRMEWALDRLRARAEPDKLLAAFTARVRAAHIRRPEPFRTDVVVVDSATLLRPPPPQSYRIIQEGEKTLLEFNGVRYQMPQPVASTMLAISKRPVFRPSDLMGALDADEILRLSRHLRKL